MKKFIHDEFKKEERVFIIYCDNITKGWRGYLYIEKVFKLP